MLPASFRKLRPKILGLLALGIVSVGLIAIISFFSLSGKITQYKGLMSQEVTATTLADNINLNFKRQVQEWKNVLLRGHVKKDRTKYWQSFNRLQGEIQQDAERFLQMDIDAGVLSTMRNFKNQHQALMDRYQQGYEAFVSSGYSHQQGDAAVRGIDREPTKLLEQLAMQLHDIVIEKSESTATGAENTIIYGVTFILLAIIASGLISIIFMNRNVVRPLTALIDHLREVSKGNFDKELTFIREDEIGRMSKAIEILRRNLLNICEEMSVTQKDLGQVCDSLVDSAGAISNGVSEQNAGTDDVSAAIHQLSMSAKDISENAQMASRSADTAKTSASEGQTVMHDTIDAIRSSSQQITDTAGVINKLDDDARSIGSVLDVIKSIAEQTNLLALNAAIEAARAGEHGRGFAVVADEVRSLAAKTQQSTEEIQQMIENVQTGAQNAVTAIEQGQQATEASVEKVLTAGSNLENINLSIQEISQLNSHIASTITEQTQVTDRIDESMEGLGEIAKLNRIHADSCAEDNVTLSDVRLRMDGVINKLMGKTAA